MGWIKLFVFPSLLLSILNSGYGNPRIQTPRAVDLKVTLQDLTSHLSDLDFRFHGQKVEMDILQEKISSLEKEVATCLAEIKNGAAHSQKLASTQVNTLESRLSELEKDQIGVAQDLKLLKQHLEKNGTALVSCQAKIGDLEKHLSTDISSLKKSIQSVLSLLKDEEGGEVYTVKPGDSLGKIALRFKISTDAIKKSNNLTKDTIFVGQEIKIPTH